MAVLEVCCYSMACAREAERCGAESFIELCAAPQEGMVTPSLRGAGLGPRGDYSPVHPIIRPRGGDSAIPKRSSPRCLAAISAWCGSSASPGW